ncbi:hypothetical protein [Nitrosopumilus sp.]|nr:hypothetical protein [Nitrosopumilus sp.]
MNIEVLSKDGSSTIQEAIKKSSVGSDSEMRKICDQILMRMKNE